MLKEVFAMRRLVFAIIAVIAASSAKADESDSVRFNRLELEDVYRFCNMTHKPGNAMLPCLFEQTEKMAREKEIELSARRSEALTRQQLRDVPGATR